MELSGVSNVVNGLLRSGANIKQGAGAAIIQETLQKGTEMDNALRTTARNEQGVGVRINVTA